MVNEEILEEYSSSIKRLRQQCLNDGMSEDEFKQLYLESLESVVTSENTQNYSRPRLRAVHLLYAVFIIIIAVNFDYIRSYCSCILSSLLCNVQEYIYPCLSLIRKLSIPLISLFPSLTDMYHETCLVQNPFFTVVDMDCWPCSSINMIREVYDPNPMPESHRPPFIYKTTQEIVDINTMKQFYFSNKQMLDNEVPKILMDSKFHVNPEDMFQQLHIEHSYIWKFNNMNEAKTLRQLISRPKVVPKFGQSIERYIIIDSSQLSSKVPDTECSYSFIIALSGSRNINLIPAEECKHQCKYLSINLEETYLLWYNWWYWRPVIQPSNGNTTFIAHVGSYC